MNVLLIGYRRTGKTAVAKIIKGKLPGMRSTPTEELRHREGKSIAQVFTDDGEPTFRDLESQVLANLVTLDRKVISLGGGVVLRPRNRSLIKGTGTVRLAYGIA